MDAAATVARARADGATATPSAPAAPGPRRLTRRERAASAFVGSAFVAVAVPLALTVPSDRALSPLLFVGLVVAYALAFELDFEVGAGYAVPTQLVLVPMLFALPTGVVPLAVAAGILLASLVDLRRGLIDCGRIAPRLANAWHAVGPALVLGLAGAGDPDLGEWPLYLAALASQFIFDFASGTARGWLAHGSLPRRQMLAMVAVYPMDAALAPVGLAIALAGMTSSYAFLLGLPLVGLLAFFARERRTRLDQALELGQAYRGTALLLGDVIEADDEYTGSHSRDVVELSVAVADEMRLDAPERRDTELAALLHDVGKVRIPNELINKAGPLSPAERELMNTHTLEGERMLDRVGGLLADVGRIVRSCHERFDGKGYPDGLAGEQIPLVARIVSCCDAFNAMTSDRSYRKGLPVSSALAELRANSGTQFDPRVVDALAAVIERGGV